MRTRVLALASFILLSFASAAIAGERGLVANSGGVLKAEPKPKGKKGEKLKQGTMVDVVDHSPDGLWLKVNAAGQEGWVEKSYVRAISRYGFSWERKDKSGGNQTVGKTTPVPAAATATATPESGWVDGEATPAATDEWENAATPAATEGDGWGNEGAATATPEPDAAATPTPEEDGWGESTEVDLTK